MHSARGSTHHNCTLEGHRTSIDAPAGGGSWAVPGQGGLLELHPAHPRISGIKNDEARSAEPDYPPRCCLRIQRIQPRPSIEVPAASQA